MTESPGGLVPQRDVLERYLASMPELRRDDVPRHHIEVLDPLLDSADMAPPDWLRIAKAIVARDAEFDGFVVLHGTDTMTHTASALSFLLQGLRKPVILTGAQLSLEHVRTDGREHLVTSIILAGTCKIPEVCIYFASRLLRGNRAQKVHNVDFVAFDSGNLAPLATVGARINVADHLLRPPGGGLPISLKFEKFEGEPHVVALRVFPGLSKRLLDTVLEGADGVVLETYGAGTFPHRERELLASISRATSASLPTVVVNVSQCHGGVVNQTTYASSRALAEAGVVSGVDMTPEAVLTKLYCLFAAGHAPADVRRMVGEDLAGELDPNAVAGV